MTDCPHPSILRFVGDNVPSMWGCATCSRRFYPACDTCVTVGHRYPADPHLAAPRDPIRVMLDGSADASDMIPHR